MCMCMSPQARWKMVHRDSESGMGMRGTYLLEACEALVRSRKVMC